MHDAPVDIPAAPSQALHHLNEIIHKDINMCDGTTVAQEWGMILRLRQWARSGSSQHGGRGAQQGWWTHDARLFDSQ
jgi:hypothetical protein